MEEALVRLLEQGNSWQPQYVLQGVSSAGHGELHLVHSRRQCEDLVRDRNLMSPTVRLFSAHTQFSDYNKLLSTTRPHLVPAESGAAEHTQLRGSRLVNCYPTETRASAEQASKKVTEIDAALLQWDLNSQHDARTSHSIVVSASTPPTSASEAAAVQPSADLCTGCSSTTAHVTPTATQLTDDTSPPPIPLEYQSLDRLQQITKASSTLDSKSALEVASTPVIMEPIAEENPEVKDELLKGISKEMQTVPIIGKPMVVEPKKQMTLDTAFGVKSSTKRSRDDDTASKNPRPKKSTKAEGQSKSKKIKKTFGVKAANGVEANTDDLYDDDDDDDDEDAAKESTANRGAMQKAEHLIDTKRITEENLKSYYEEQLQLAEEITAVQCTDENKLSFNEDFLKGKDEGIHSLACTSSRTSSEPEDYKLWETPTHFANLADAFQHGAMLQRQQCSVNVKKGERKKDEKGYVPGEHQSLITNFFNASVSSAVLQVQRQYERVVVSKVTKQGDEWIGMDVVFYRNKMTGSDITESEFRETIEAAKVAAKMNQSTAKIQSDDELNGKENIPEPEPLPNSGRKAKVKDAKLQVAAFGTPAIKNFFGKKS